MTFNADLCGEISAPLLSREQLVVLVEKAQNGDDLAKQQVLLANVGLVRKLANKYLRQSASVGTDIRDLFQEGIIGLNRAIEKFDCTSGYAFSTYAMSWIDQSISKFVHTNSANINSTECRHGSRLVAQIRADFESRHNRQPTKEEICQIGHITPMALERYSAAPVIISSYDQMSTAGQDNGDDRAVTLTDTLVGQSLNDDPTAGMDAVLDLCMALDDLNLSDLERQVIEMRFGFGEYVPHSFSAIAKAVRRRPRDIEMLVSQVVRRLRNHDRLSAYQVQR